MCYSFKTSIISFTSGIFSSIFAFYTGQIELGMLILFYCQMQLSEAIVWKGIDENNIELNRKGTKYGKYLLATHNIAIGLGILIVSYLNLKDNEKLNYKNFIPLIVGTLFFFVILYIYSKDVEEKKETYPLEKCDDRKCQNSKNRLQWPFKHEWYLYSFIISFIFLVLYINPIKSKIFLTSIYSITFLLTVLFFNSKNVGSVWCFSAAILSPIIVIVNHLILKKVI